MLNPKLTAGPAAAFGGRSLSTAIAVPCIEKLLIQP